MGGWIHPRLESGLRPGCVDGAPATRVRGAERLTRRRKGAGKCSTNLVRAGCMQSGVRNDISSAVLSVCRSIGAEISGIPVGVRNRLLEGIAVDILAPLHVVEEERLVLLGPEVDRTSSVKTEGVL